MVGGYERPEVRIGGAGPYSVELRLHSLACPFPDVVDDPVRDFLVTARGERVDVEVGVRTWAGDGLPEFLTELAEDFRGWAGVRSWRSLERDLTLSAQHSGGYVHLTWRLCGRPADGWHFETTTDHAPGEDMRNLAADVRSFLGVGGSTDHGAGHARGVSHDTANTSKPDISATKPRPDASPATCGLAGTGASCPVGVAKTEG